MKTDVAAKGITEFLDDKTVLIMGFGREGRSTYNYIRKHMPGKPLVICDKNDIADEALSRDLNVRLVCGENYTDIINDFDVVIKSPGIAVCDLRINDDVFVTCQTDLFMKYSPATKIGITGTKGKTTTSTLTYDILKAAGINTCLVGNIGVPVLDIIDDSLDMIAVIEMSSHQLEFTRTSPHVAVLTNIYEEHLDHYNGFEGYVAAKMNIVKHQHVCDFFIRNREQDIAQFIDPSLIKSQQILIGADEGCRDEFLASLVGINPHLPGRQGAQDTFFAATAAGCLGVGNAAIKKGIESFEGIPHRLEFVGKYDGIDFYNDCIATVPTAVMLGVDALERVNTLIIGGMDRGLDYSDFEKELSESDIKNIICMPETGYQIGDALKKIPGVPESKNIIEVRDMKEAVDVSFDVTEKGKICLISPAASSYNYYKNFEEKGDHFKALVREHD